MKVVQFVGGSYALNNRKADVQRSINLFPSIVESRTGKAPAILKSIPGLTLFANAGAEIRGIRTVGNRLFMVAGNSLIEATSAGVLTTRGTLSTATGPVDMAYGTTQLVIVDGSTTGYLLTLASNAFATIGGNYTGSTRVGYLDGYFLFIRPNSGQFYWSAINDASSIPSLNFATAEGSPDNLVSLLVDHRELWLFGTETTEIWVNTGSESVFERSGGAFIEHGCAAPHSAQKLDNSVFWLGSDDKGNGVVWRALGYSPVRVSTHAVEESIQRSTDMASARAYTYQQDGHSFYALQVPGLDTTWVFDVAAGQWHERAELVNGAYAQHRATCHAFAFGKHLIGATDGKVYQLDATKHNNAGDVLVRDRISPHFDSSSLEDILFSEFEIDCEVGAGKPDGTAPLLMLRYSNDGGHQFGAWRTVSLGAIGQRLQRARFHRCGSGRDRVWQVRCTEDAPFSIVSASIRAQAL